MSGFSTSPSIVILQEVQRAGVISYAIGNWPAPWGIEYRIDAANAFMLVLLGFVAAVVAPYAWASVRVEVPRENHL